MTSARPAVDEQRQMSTRLTLNLVKSVSRKS
jgi:hypothetical protein